MMRTLIAIAALVASVSASAGILKASTLNDFCNADGDEYQRVVFDAGCTAYVTGVWDLYVVMMADPENPDSNRRGGFCKPKGATGKQLGAIVAKYLAEHPELWHINASVSVLGAFAEAFPCE
jgi:hypothetical protein